MLLYVYRLRRQGRKVPRETIVAEVVRGNVRIDGYPSGWGGRRVMTASVYRDGSYELLVPALGDVQMRVRDALVVTGLEDRRFPQAWVCSLEPIPVERWPLVQLPPARPPSPRAASGFDPADDDRMD